MTSNSDSGRSPGPTSNSDSGRSPGPTSNSDSGRSPGQTSNSDSGRSPGLTALRRLALPLILALLIAACGGGGDGTSEETPAAGGTSTPGSAAPAATETASAEPDASATTPGAGASDTPAPGATSEPGEPAATADAGSAPVTFVGPGGEEVTYEAELAADPATRQVGLMNRTELEEGTGMLFLFPQDSAGGFWMKNTLIPLQIAFLSAEGEIVDILEMVPCEEDPCPVYTPDGAYRYALEVGEGALDAAGIDESWRVELPADLPDAT